MLALSPQMLPALEFHDQQVRTMLRDGEPWFVLADVCAVLDITNSRDAASRLDGVAARFVQNCTLRSSRPQGRPLVAEERLALQACADSSSNCPTPSAQEPISQPEQ